MMISMVGHTRPRGTCFVFALLTAASGCGSDTENAAPSTAGGATDAGDAAQAVPDVSRPTPDVLQPIPDVEQPIPDASQPSPDAIVADVAQPSPDADVPTGCIPADRIVRWSPGRSIPRYPASKTACNAGCDFTTRGDDSTDDSAILTSCLTAAPVGGACLVKRGTYALGKRVVVPSGRVLRGEGQGKTILNNRNGEGIAVALSGSGIANGSQVSLAGGYTKDSTWLAFAAAPGIAVGDYLAVTESPDPTIVNANGIDGMCTWCGGPWNLGAGKQFMAQIVKVTSISGNAVTIDRPLYFTFLASLAPAVLRFSNIVENAGVESLTINEKNTGAGQNQGLVHFYGCSGCWAKDVEVSGAYGEFVELQFSKGCVVRDCYLHDPQMANSGRGYGVHVMFWNSDHLIENNVMVKNRHSMAFEGGGSGVVVAYNFMYRDWESDSDPQWLGDDLITHGAHAYMSLIEGNVHQQLQLDDYWGSSSHMTYFRNNPTATGDYQIAATENLASMIVDKDNRYPNLVGNILGTATRQGATSYDSAVASTIVRCSNAYVGSAAKVDGDCGCALPPSLYLTAAPSWFATPFGAPPWPPVGPDVNGSVNKIPAQLCYENTVGKGLQFDGTACYGP